MGVRQSGDSLSNDSKMKLSRLLANKGMTLFPDQLDALYSRILPRHGRRHVRLGGVPIVQERICKECMTKWLDSYLESQQVAADHGGHEVKDKLAVPGLRTAM